MANAMKQIFGGNNQRTNKQGRTYFNQHYGIAVVCENHSADMLDGIKGKERNY